MIGQTPLSVTIIRTAEPDSGLRTALSVLSARCMQHDDSRVAYPYQPEENALHYLAAETSGDTGRMIGASSLKLAAAIAFLPQDADTAECIAFTDPAFRRRGCFSALLNALVNDFPDCDLFFPVSGKAKDARAALAAIGAEHDHDDLLMSVELAAVNLPAFQTTADTYRAVRTSHESTVNMAGHQPDSPETGCSNTALPVSHTPHASFRLLPVSAATVCLYDVEVKEAYRGQGLGTAMIRELLNELPHCGFSHIILHVSGDNAPAVALYKKTGFRIAETLSYYLY